MVEGRDRRPELGYKLALELKDKIKSDLNDNDPVEESGWFIEFELQWFTNSTLEHASIIKMLPQVAHIIS